MAKKKKILHTTERGLSENGFCVLNGKIDKKKNISFDKQTRRRHHHHRRPTQHTPHSLLQIYFAKKKKIQSTYTNQTQYYMFNKLINKLNQTKKKNEK